MPEHGVPEGAISREDIAELAALFDRFEYAFDPLSLRANEAESKFEDRVDDPQAFSRQGVGSHFNQNVAWFVVLAHMGDFCTAYSGPILRESQNFVLENRPVKGGLFNDLLRRFLAPNLL